MISILFLIEVTNGSTALYSITERFGLTNGQTKLTWTINSIKWSSSLSRNHQPLQCHRKPPNRLLHRPVGMPYFGFAAIPEQRPHSANRYRPSFSPVRMPYFVGPALSWFVVGDQPTDQRLRHNCRPASGRRLGNRLPTRCWSNSIGHLLVK